MFHIYIRIKTFAKNYRTCCDGWLIRKSESFGFAMISAELLAFNLFGTFFGFLLLIKSTTNHSWDHTFRQKEKIKTYSPRSEIIPPSKPPLDNFPFH